MAPSVKNSTTGELINPFNWNNRVPSMVDSEKDFYDKSNASFKGFLFNSNKYNDNTGAPQTISGSAYPATVFKVGPYNEITIQKVGSATVTVTGSIDGKNYVAANLTTSADGLIRINSLYRFITVSASGVASTDSCYMQVW